MTRQTKLALIFIVLFWITVVPTAFYLKYRYDVAVRREAIIEATRLNSPKAK